MTGNLLMACGGSTSTPPEQTVSDFAAYYPLMYNGNDYNGNYNLSSYGTITYGLTNGRQCANFSAAASMNTNAISYIDNTDVSMGGWLNLKQDSTGYHFGISLYGTYFSIFFYDTPNKIQVRAYDGSFRYSAGSHTFAYDTWYHVFATYNDTTKEVKLYVNGVYVESIQCTNSITKGAYFTLGSTNTSIDFYGRFQHVRYYKRVLTPEEVALIYTAES